MANSVKIGRALPSPLVDTNEGATRGGRYGEQIVQLLHGKKQVLADEGSYFVATTTPGTAIVGTATITSFLDAGLYGGILRMTNSESKSNAAAKRVYPDYIKLLMSAAWTGGTSIEYALLIDDVASRTSGGTAITPVNVNGDSAVPSITTISFGALTAIAATNRRVVGRGRLSGTTPSTLSTAIIVFGAVEGGGSVVTGPTTGRMVEIAPPVILGPQWNLILNMWAASMTGVPTFEFEIGFWER